VDRKVVEISGQMYVEAPKNRKFRRTSLAALVAVDERCHAVGSSRPRGTRYVTGSTPP
jgi:hypothetical protein